MHRTRDLSAPLVVNLVSETVGGSTGHGVHTAFLQTRTALERAGCEVRVNAGPGCDIVHIETMGLRSLYMLLRTRERALVTAHITPASFIGSFLLAGIWWPIGALYLTFFYAFADEVLAVSPEVVAGLERMHVGAPVRYIPNAIDVSRFEPRPEARTRVRERLGIAPDAKVVLCAGQVQPRKGVRAFIKAAREMPDVTFVWAGGMPFKYVTAGYWEMTHVKSAAPANCFFIGDVPYEEMPDYYAAADCLFFPSKQETFGLAILEAAAARLPLVVRDLGTYRPLFGDAYLAGDEATFVARLREVLDDADAHAVWSKRAHDMATRFDVSRQSALLLRAYEDVLARGERERAKPARVLRPALQWAFGSRQARR